MKNIFKCISMLIVGLVLSQAHGMDLIQKLKALKVVKVSPANERLFKGVQNNDYASVAQAIKDGADLDKGILFPALAQGDMAMVALLLDKGADPNMVIYNNDLPFNALVFVLRSEHAEQAKINLIKLLFFHNLDMKKICNQEATLALVDSVAIGRILIQAGLDLTLLKQTIKELEAETSNIETQLDDDDYAMSVKVCAALKEAYKLEVINPNKKKLSALAKTLNRQYKSWNAFKDILREIASEHFEIKKTE